MSSITPPEAAIEGQSMPAMSWMPSLVLAAAPAWYLFVGRKNLVLSPNAKPFYKILVALTLLAMEYSQWRYRQRLYRSASDMVIVTMLSAFMATCVSASIAVSNIRQAPNLQMMLTMSMDVAVIMDTLKTGHYMLDVNITSNILFLASSISRSVIFILPIAWQLIQPLYDSIAEKAMVSGLRCIWESPFSLVTLENIEDLGPEFNAEHLLERFHQVWLQYANPRVPRYALFWATLWTMKWECTLILIVRCWVGVATLARPQAILQSLTIIQQQDTNAKQQWYCIVLLLFTFFGKAVFEQLLSRLSHRYLICLHTMWSGEIMDKTLRLKAEETPEINPDTIVGEDIKQLMIALPNCANSTIGAIELGVITSILWQYLGAASLICFASFIVITQISSLLLNTIHHRRLACERASQNRVAQSDEVYSQIKGIKAIGNQATMAEYLRNLHETEVITTKSMRLLQMVCCFSHDAIGAITSTVLLFCAVKQTNIGASLQPSMLFAILTAVNIAVNGLTAVYTGYQHVPILLSSHDRVQNFLCLQERHTSRVDERPIERRIIHSCMNYMSLSCLDGQIPAPNTPIPNQDQLQLLDVSIIAPGGVSPLFENVSISVPRGGLTVVIGITASGKTQFLKALLDEVEHIGGRLFLERNTSVAYCDQTVWLQHKSVKDNILGGNVLDEQRYALVIEKCELQNDLQLLPYGDQTIISTGAVNLSTSQQHKIAMARGVYSPASVLILDDPFRVLDRETGDNIFNSLFKEDGFLKQEGRTVVLATSFRRYMADADLAIILDSKGNVITREGGQSFPVNAELRNVIRQLEYAAMPSLLIKTAMSATHPGNDVLVEPDIDEVNENPRNATILATFFGLLPMSSKLYLSLSMAFAAVTCTLSDGFPGIWLDTYCQSNSRFAVLLLLAALSTAATIAVWSYFYEMLVPFLCRTTHSKLVKTMMNAELFYLTAANYSEILHQLSKDITILARGFGMSVFKLMYYVSLLITDTIVILLIVPECGFPLVICLAGLHCLIQKYYLPSSQNAAQRQQRASTSLLTHIKEVISGVEHIRAFGWQQQFKDRGLLLMNQWQIPFFRRLDAMRWLGFILASVAAFASVLITAIGIWTERISPSQVGVSLILISWLPEKTNFIAVEYVDLQSYGGSLLRLVEAFEHVPQETDRAEPRENAGSLGIGSIELQDVTARYGHEAESKPVLDSASLAISAGQKAILVGRSGSGKSSIILSILRFLNFSGTIKVGGVDISKIPRAALRTQISVMPPESLRMPGTVEQNLLPWRLMGGIDNISEETIQQVLKHVYLRMHIYNSGGLQMSMKDLKLSEGQKTQFAMARLVFHHRHYENKIVLMDEPTGGLDDAMRLHLDQLIENYFEGSTVLTVSRDPESITHADVVFYLEEGEVRKAPSNQAV